MFGNFLKKLRKKKGSPKPNDNEEEKPPQNKKATEKQNPKQKAKQAPKKGPKKPVKKERKNLPPIGQFKDGVDFYGNLEDRGILSNIPKMSLLEDLASTDTQLFQRIFDFLSIKETVGTTTVSKSVRIGLRDCPLRFDLLATVTALSHVERCQAPVEFPDGVIQPAWHVGGVIVSVANPADLFALLDAKRLVQVGFANPELVRIDALAECENVEKIEFHNCLQLEDISPLAGLRKLKSAYFMKNEKLADISPLTGIPSLEDVNFFQCENIENLSPISGCRNIKRLSLTQNKKIMDFSPLQALENLERIDLSRNEHLETLDCLPDVQSVTYLVLIGCENLKDISWVENHAESLQKVRLMACPRVEDISPLKNAYLLNSLIIAQCPVASFEALDSMYNLEEFVVDNCLFAKNMVNLFKSMENVEKIVLKDCMLFSREDALALNGCRKIYVFEASTCRAAFLGELMKSKNIVLREGAIAALKAFFQTARMSNIQFALAKEFVDTLLLSCKLSTKDKDEVLLTLDLLQELQKMAYEVRGIATGVLKSNSFPMLLEAMNPDTPVKIPEPVRKRVMGLFHAVFSSELQSIEKVYEDPVFLLNFIAKIRGKRDALLDLEDPTSPKIYNDEAMIAVNIIAVLIANVKRAIFEDAPQPDHPDLTRSKLPEIRIFQVIVQILQTIEESEVLEDLSDIISLEYPQKQHQGAAYKVFNELTEMVIFYNEVVARRSEFVPTKNADFVMEHLQLPSILDDVLPLVLKSLPEMDIGVKITASSWLIRLLKEKGEPAKQTLLEEKDAVMKILNDVFIFSVSAVLARFKDNSDIPIETVTNLINTGCELIQLVPPEIFPELLNPDNKLESVRVIVHLIEIHTDILGDFIKTENIAVPMFMKYQENPEKQRYIKHVIALFDALMVVANELDACPLLVQCSDKTPGVIATLLHLATDELSLFEKAINALLHLSNASETFKSKLQYLYTNSDIAVAFKLFMDPPPQYRPRVAKSFAQKELGLKLLSLLLDSQNFRTKFLDCGGKERNAFIEQFHRFVYKVEASEGREDFEGLKLCGEIVGKLIGAEISSPAKVKSLIVHFVKPVVDDLKALEDPAKAEQFMKQEDEAKEFDVTSALPRSERDPEQNANNPLQAIFSQLLGSPGGDRRPPANNASSVAEEVFGFSRPNTDTDEAPRPESPPQLDFGTLFGSLFTDFNPNPQPRVAEVEPVVDVPVRESSQKETLSWAFRCSLFLSHVFSSSSGFLAMGVLDQEVLDVVIRWSQTSGNMFDDVDAENDQFPNLPRRATLVKASATRLISVVLNELLNSAGKKMLRVEGMTVDADFQDQNDAEFEQVAADAPARPNIFNLFQATNTRATEQLEQQKRAAAAEVRVILNKQRQLNYVKKLAKKLNSTESKETRKVKKKELSSKAKKRIDEIYERLALGDNSEDTLGHCVDLLENCPVDFGLVSAFALISGLCRVSAMKKDEFLVDLMGEKPELLEIIDNKFLLLESENHASQFLEILIDNNPDLAVQVLMGLLSNYHDPNLKNEEAGRKRLGISKLLLGLFSGKSEIAKKLRSVFENDWSIAANVTTFLPLIRDQTAETETSLNLLKVLSFLVKDLPNNFIDLVEAGGSKLFLTYLVEQLGSSSNDVAQTAISILGDTFESEKINEEDNGVLAVISKKILDAGILEMLQCWREVNGSRKLADQLTSWEKHVGLTIIGVAIASGNPDVLDSEKDVVVPTLIELLVENPTPKLANLLVNLDKDGFGGDAPEALYTALERYESFIQAMEREKAVQERQSSDNDVVMKRVRGLPQEVVVGRKYNFKFGKSLSTVAVTMSEEIPALQKVPTYFEVEIVPGSDFVSGSVGVVGKSFGHGPFAGTLAEGVNEDGESCGLELSDDDKNTVIGVVLKPSKKKIVFKKNGRKAKVVQDDNKVVSLFSDGFLPAVSGKGFKCRVNLGQHPFKYSPPSKAKSYLQVVKESQ